MRQSPYIVRKMCAIAAKKVAPRSIPISGDNEKIAARDYFSVSGYRAGSNFFFFLAALSSDGKVGLDCYYHDSWRERPGRRIYVTAESVANRPLFITQYYKSQELRFRSASTFLLSYFFRRHWWSYQLETLKQRIFNKTRRTVAARMRVLEAAVQRMTETGSRDISPAQLVPGNRNRRIYWHPQYSQLETRTRFILESFVESGEIENGTLGYRLAPKALATLDNYVLERKRHRSLTALQVIGVLVATGQVLNVTPGTALDRLIDFTRAKAESLWLMAQPILSYLESPWLPEQWALTGAEYLQRLPF